MEKVRSQEDVLVTIKNFIIDNFLFGNKEHMTGPEESFMENGIIDSLGITELIEFCEDTYTITIEDEELIPENLDSLNNISRFIINKQ